MSEENEINSTIYQNLWDAMKEIRGKFISVNALKKKKNR